MSKIKTPLRYPGGKSRVADTLVDLMPEFKEYREPFLGGGSVFISAKQTHPFAKFWVNDLYYDLYCFWKQVGENTEELVREIRETREYWTTGEGADLGGKYMHDKLVADIRVYKEEEVLDRAIAFFVINRVTFSGISLAGGYSQESFEKRFTESSINRIEKVAPLLKDVNITSLDYSEVLSAPGEDVFIFLDPPYYTATKSGLYGRRGELHRGFDHERLAEELRKCPHKWMMTYDNCDYIKNVYKDYNIIPFEFAYGMRNTGKNSEMTGKEILITNYTDF